MFYPLGAQQQTRRAATAVQRRETDRRTTDRYIDRADAHNYAGSVNNMHTRAAVECVDG